MRKNLVPMLVSLALCGGATTAMVISSARAQPSPHTPMLVAMASEPGSQLAQNDAPPPPDGAPPPRDLRRPAPADMAARVKQMCQDGLARETGQLAYLETRLEITAAERPLFDRWKGAKLAIAQRHADTCAQRPLPQRRTEGQASSTMSRPAMPSPADMMTREEDRLKQRLADIDAERPSLEALCNSLSQGQKMELLRASRDRMDGPGRHMFADARGPRGPMGPMGPGSMGQAPMGMGPMDRAPGAPYGSDAPPPAER